MPIIVEYKKIFESPLLERFRHVEDLLKRDAIKQATEAWGIPYDNHNPMYPQGNKFGETTIRTPFVNIGTASGSAETWNRTLSNTGWQTLINQNVIEGVYLGVLGFVLPNTAQKIAAVQLTGGAVTLPVVNFEGYIKTFEEPTILFDTGVIIPEEKKFQLDVLATSTGSNVIQPLGFALAKSKILIAKKPV